MSTNKAEDAITMAAYVQEGERRAYDLGNRGPIRLNSDGILHKEITDAYWRCGFYVFEGALSTQRSSKTYRRILSAYSIEHRTRRMHRLIQKVGPHLGRSLRDPASILQNR